MESIGPGGVGGGGVYENAGAAESTNSNNIANAKNFVFIFFSLLLYFFSNY
jgi:hypothetical protein